MKFILGQKLEMSQMFDSEGNVIPVTLVLAGPCQITQIKTKEKDGYEAVQIGFQKISKEKKVKKPQAKKPFKYLREFRNNIGEFQIDQEINASLFQEGDKVAVTGISKGKGFQGAVKRWSFAGQSATRGTKHEHRTIGSVGSRYPQHVRKGKKMPGRMGSDRTTVRNLKIIKVDKDNNLLAINGAVPGRRGTLLEIRSLL
ncbi:MAG: 50S ribosomal protein L3 [Patescibacteria group bacterium]|nr:50S ribosomal protein L3 [Patescibacteria group bacterium]MBU1876970.1 50S ribosomal protein L3 [Patescibacteria group bacterium]